MQNLAGFSGANLGGKFRKKIGLLKTGLILQFCFAFQNLAGFSGANSRKNWPIFAGKKLKFTEKSADFAGFSREESQNSQKTWLISTDFSGKKSNFEGFSGANY